MSTFADLRQSHMMMQLLQVAPHLCSLDLPACVVPCWTSRCPALFPGRGGALCPTGGHGQEDSPAHETAQAWGYPCMHRDAACMLAEAVTGAPATATCSRMPERRLLDDDDLQGRYLHASLSRHGSIRSWHGMRRAPYDAGARVGPFTTSYGLHAMLRCCRGTTTEVT